MKKINYIIIASAIVTIGMYACSDDWNSHYSKQETVVENEEVVVVEEPADNFLQAEQEYSEMYRLFDKTGVLDTWKERGLLYTMMVVNNNAATGDPTSRNTTEDAGNSEDVFLAKAHITDAFLSPGNLQDGQKLLMWNGKYVTVTKLDAPADGKEAGIYFNDAKVKKVIKTDNAYIYELEEYIYTPKSLMEYLESLPNDQYSIFKQMILDRTEKVFDKSASTPIGVDQTGNTVYDSVWTVKSQYFEKKGINLYSETIHATMLVPSNDLITKALQNAYDRLEKWKLQREDSIMRNWIFQAAFFKEKYTRETFEDPVKIDLSSIFGKQWRTTVNKVDLDNPVELSNGIAYKMTELKLPTNTAVVWRLKERMATIDELTEDEIKEYYYPEYVKNSDTDKDIGVNMKLNRVKWTCISGSYGPGGAPGVRYGVLILSMRDKTAIESAQCTFKCYRMVDDPADPGNRKPEPYLFPPGEYTFAMGFHGSHSNSDVNFYINGKLVAAKARSFMKGMNFDRGGGGFNEFYSDSKYDRDGTTICTYTVEGDEPQELSITLELPAGGANGASMEALHWCFRPTANNY